MRHLLRSSAALAAILFGASSASAQCDLTTLFNGGNGLGVNSVCYFDLNAANSFLVTGLDVNTSTTVGNPITIELYTRSGTYVGNTASSAGWSLVGTGTGTASAQFSPTVTTFGAPVLFNPGITGMCVRYVNLTNRYTNGNGTNQFYSNAFYSLTLGQSAGSAFAGGTINNRVWNGTIHCTPAQGIYANFSATPTSGASPLNVQFTDTTYTSDPGGITSWAWDLDGDNLVDSNAQNPSFTYNTCGYYSVTLTATDVQNGQSTITKSNFITVDPQLLVTASFTVANTGPLSRQFTDTSTGSPSLWSWDFDGDNVPDSAQQNPSWTYPSAGTYTVSLSASNACGASISRQQIVVITNDDCVGAIPAVAGTNGPFSNVGAANSGSFTCGGTTDRDLWFSYTPSCNVNVEVNTCGTSPSFDTKISVHSGACGALTQLACNDDAGAGCGVSALLSRVSNVPMTGGQTYYIAIGGFSGASGTFVFDIIATPTGNGSFTTVSPGCGGTGLVATGNPNIGGSVDFTMAPVSGLPLVNLGYIPLGIPICAGGCVLGATLDATFPGATLAGPIPCDPLLQGGTIYAQGIDLGAAGGCAAGDPIVLTLSDTIRLVIG